MARITVEDCLDHVENRFQLVLTGSKRARQIAVGGKEPMVPLENDKPTVLALREISLGLVTEEVLNQPTELDELADAAEAAEATEELPKESPGNDTEAE